MREFAFNVCMLYELVFNLLLKKEHIDCVNEPKRLNIRV